jgi:hypothetical protein
MLLYSPVTQTPCRCVLAVMSRPVGEGGMYFRRGDDVGSVEITA